MLNRGLPKLRPPIVKKISSYKINADMMSMYIEYVADRLLVSLGYDRIYHSLNPFDWMEMISLQGKTNFFEKRVGDYQKSGVMNSAESKAFSLDEVGAWVMSKPIEGCKSCK